MLRRLSKIFLIICLFTVSFSLSANVSEAAEWELVTQNPPSTSLKQFVANPTTYNYKLVLEGNIGSVVLGYTASDNNFVGLRSWVGPGTGVTKEYDVTSLISSYPASYYGIRIENLASGAKATIYRQLKNNAPVLSITNSGDKSLYNDGGSFSISGTIQDPDNDSVTISATIGGTTKSVVVAGTSSIQPWTLTWSGTEIPVGTYTNPQVNANDGKESISVNYSGTLTINPQIYYYWSKYSVAQVPTKWAKVYSTDLDYIDGDTEIYYSNSYVFNASTGLFQLKGTVSLGKGKDLSPSAMEGKYFMIKTQVTDDYKSEYVRYLSSLLANDNIAFYRYSAEAIEYRDGRGSVIQPNIRAAQGTYPDDGLHTDGFWYVKTGSVPNNPPSGTVNQINQRPTSNQSTITLTGTASDPDGDTLLIEATLGGIKAQTSVTNTATSKSWTLTWNKSEVPDGTYTNIPVTISDGK